MHKAIHHLRKQPEHVKRHMLHMSTIVCAVVLVVLWVYSLGVHLSNTDVQNGVTEAAKPFSVLKDNIPESW